MSHSVKIPLPKTEQDFEAMCSHVYGKEFNCHLPVMYGRRGQKQYGLDVLINQNDVSDKEHRIGIQCKHVQNLSYDDASGDSVIKEIKKADAGKLEIKTLIIATTLPSDAKLIPLVEALSEERAKKGKFGVKVQFWGDIENKISQDPVLLKKYEVENSLVSHLFDMWQSKISNESYKDALQIVNLKENELHSYNMVENFERLCRLAISFNTLDDKSDFLETLDKLRSYEWVDHRLAMFEVIASLFNDDVDGARQILNDGLRKFPSSIQLKSLDVQISMSSEGVDVDFDDLESKLKQTHELKMIFLDRACMKDDFLLFEKVFSTLSPDEKLRKDVRVCELLAKAQKFHSEKVKDKKTKEDIEEILFGLRSRLDGVWSA